MSEIVESQSDATEASSEPTQTQQVESTPEQNGSATAQSEASTPFHEHPRFRELVEQKNQALEMSQKLQARLEALETAQTKSSGSQQSAEDALIARLKGIDPEFGGRIEQFQAKIARMEELEQRLVKFEQKDTQSTIQTTFKGLCDQYKVPADLQVRYEREIRALAAANPKLGLNDLPSVFKTVHEDYTKMLDGIRRAERESYVAGKKADASKPVSQPKGKSPDAAKKAVARDAADERSSTVGEVLKLMRANREI